MTIPRLRLAPLVLALLLGLIGCGERRSAEGGPQTQLRPDDVVVATVGGVPISAARVAAHGRAIGAEPRAALDDLIGFELLAQEAARRGLGRGADVAEARTREMARRLLAVEFEAHHRPDDIPEADLRREYERNRRHFEHPEIRSVVTALFPARRGAVKPPDEARAKAAAQELSERWRAEQPVDGKAAGAIVDTYFGHLGGVRVSAFNTYHGAEAEPEWLRVALALKEHGAVSMPVRTKYGWHVIYLDELHPARNTPEAEALATIRKELHPVWQRAAFARYLEAVTARHQLAQYPERLPTVAARAPAAPAP